MSNSGTHTPSISEGGTKRQRDSHASAKGGETDASVTPGRRDSYYPDNEVSAPGLGYHPTNYCACLPAPMQKRIKTSAPEPVNPVTQGQSITGSLHNDFAGHTDREP